MFYMFILVVNTILFTVGVFELFVVISSTFRPICSPAFFRCLLNSGTSELRTTYFIESTRVACSDSVSHNQVKVLSPAGQIA